MFTFEKLHVYQDSLLFVDFLYKATKNWPKDEIFGLTSQLKRSVVSITLNIAEGSSRTKKDFRHFLDLARGSCYECVAILSIAKQRKYITEEEYRKMYEHANKIARTINALKASLQ